MSRLRLILRSLVFYRRTHAAVVCGVAVATAVLAGALAVGDSVRYSLRRAASLRLGKAALALAPRERFFRQRLAGELQRRLARPVAPVISLRGTASNARLGRRANIIRVIGVDERFWSLGEGDDLLAPGGDCVAVNARLAGKLRCQVGDRVLVRIEKPAALSREAPLSAVDDASVGALLTVAAVAGDEQMGGFALQANQIPPHNAFVPLALLQKLLDLDGKANMLLVGEDDSGAGVDPEAAERALRSALRVEDMGLALRELPEAGVIELRSDRIFLDRPVVDAAEGAAPAALGVLTYFVNEIRNGPHATPYSMVSAVGALAGDRPLPSPLPTELPTDQIVINEWLAEDLHAGPGDRIDVTYFVLGPMRRLIERTSSFEVRQVAPMTGLAADRQLMPDFPGLAVADDCADWRPGVPIDLARIRRKDESYWDDFRGTPKAFIALQAGREIWANRFGSLTAIRYPAARTSREQIASSILARLNPSSLGLAFSPVADQARQASEQATDFGQLFLALSVFLVAAALLLTGLLAALGIDQRSGQVGILLALGFRARSVRRLLMTEGLLLALVGSAIGAPAGLGYARLVLGGLRTVWSGAVAGSALHYHAEPATVALAAAIGLAIASIAMWLVLRRKAAGPVRELLGEQLGEVSIRPAGPLRRTVMLTGGIGSAAIALIAALAGGVSADRAVGAFFAAGTLLLLAGLLASWHVFSSLLPSLSGRRMTVAALALRNTVRRRGRSLAVVAILACGVFLITAVAANRRDPTVEPLDPSSGTGGFALMGRSSLAVFRDLNDPAEQGKLGLDAAAMQGARLVPVRVRQGDEASCLNLNRAQTPSVLGIPADRFEGAFKFVKPAARARGANGWDLLAEDLGPDVVPAVADHATVVWALGRRLGDELAYLDDRGKTFRIRIVAVLADSIFQGRLLISQQNFEQRFESVTGFREFLVSAPPGKADAVAGQLEDALRNFGMEAVPTGEILAGFLAVQNTYLSIFQALGGLGMLLASAGLGLVVARNVLERRSELALMRAVGFPKRSLVALTFIEHSGLLAGGLVFGAVAALIAVAPALLSPGSDVSFGWLAAVLLLVAGSGALWVYFAAVLALRGPLLAALRNE